MATPTRGASTYFMCQITQCVATDDIDCVERGRCFAQPNVKLTGVQQRAATGPE
jgi:hypothetical protein